MIKPDAVKAKHVGHIVSEIEREFEIIAVNYTHLNTIQARKFYAIHKGKDFYKPLIAFMTSGPVVAVLLRGDNIQQRLRDFIGATDPKKARKGTIRQRFGKSTRENAVHASNPLENPEQEIKFFFPNFKSKQQ